MLNEAFLRDFFRMPRAEVVPDKDSVLKAAMAIHKARQERGFGGQAGWAYEPAEIKELHLHTARAVIAALAE